MSYDLEYGKFRDKPLAWLRNNEPDYSDAQYLIKRWPKAFAMVPYTAHSRQYDYGGPTHESNYRVWKESFSDTENKTWWDLGDNGIFVRIDIAPKDQKEAIDSLESYPILDEDDESHLTMEIQDENWKDYGLRDTRDELAERADPGLREAVDALFEKMPEQIFANAYYEQISNEGNGPEQDGGGYGTIFPRAFEDWDGLSFSDLLAWLGLEEAVVRVNLSDAAFTSWTPSRKGEQERKLRITKEQLKQSLGEMKVSSAQLARLMRNEEIVVPLTEEFPCESLYVSCSYPWETEEEEEQTEGASEMTRENPIAAADTGGDDALICMGRDIVLEIGKNDYIELPERWGMLHDPSGNFWPSCSLLFAPFRQGTEEDDSDEGRGYFGNKTDVWRGHVKVPPHDLHHGWHEVGIVQQVFYERAGKHAGRYKHKFNDPRGWMWLVALFKSHAAKTPPVLFEYYDCNVVLLRLELPDGCVVDDRGIALP